jgi:tetratricopeptide (TPR) repeat protein
MGDLEGACDAYRNAADAVHPEASPIAAFQLGVLLAGKGDLDGARDAYLHAVSFGTAQITNAAARHNEAPHPDVNVNSPGRDKAITSAALELGILLAQDGDADGARAAYHQAVEFGHTSTAPSPMVRLALAMTRHADMETAQAAFQSALDSGHPPAVAVASFGLGNMLAEQGDSQAAHIAFQRAIDYGNLQLAAAASLSLGWLLAEHGDNTAARDAFQRAARSEDPQIAEEAARNLQSLPLTRGTDEPSPEQAAHQGTDLPDGESAGLANPGAGPAPRSHQ